MNGKIGEWRFDKRSYEETWPPRNLSLPPAGVPESVVCNIFEHLFYLKYDNDTIRYNN